MNTITEKEYRDILNKHKELIELIISTTTRLSLMLYNKPPKGDFITDLDELDEEDGKICVQFKSWSCGESDYSTFYLPLEFLFDETYPEKYKLICEEEKRKEKEEKIKIELLKKENEKLRTEAFEIREFERLKLKFEKKD